MKSVLATLVLAVFSSTSFALPPADAPSYEDGLRQSSSYLQVVQQLQPTSQKIVQTDKYELVEKLGEEKLRGCNEAILSRSGVIMSVTFTTNSGDKTILFGTTEDPTQFKACASL